MVGILRFHILQVILPGFSSRTCLACRLWISTSALNCTRQDWWWWGGGGEWGWGWGWWWWWWWSWWWWWWWWWCLLMPDDDDDDDDDDDGDDGHGDDERRRRRRMWRRVWTCMWMCMRWTNNLQITRQIIVISVQHQHAGMSSLIWLEEKATCFVTKSWKMLISRSWSQMTETRLPYIDETMKRR